MRSVLPLSTQVTAAGQIVEWLCEPTDYAHQAIVQRADYHKARIVSLTQVVKVVGQRITFADIVLVLEPEAPTCSAGQ